jgi:phage shock protein PspC (stress-responsive transcriptional regulator)
MNKILNINLGGYALTIDDDAYEYLQAYLESIRRRFSESEGRDEIVADIETRLGEILTEMLGSRTIIMLPDVEAAVTVMGKPEDFGGETVETEQPKQQAKSSKRGSGLKPGKRLFRDEEDAVVAGICSGLSAYFGITDPVWMRLFFVVLAFVSFGFWVPAYVLLWILVPPAKSAADRLAMRGEPVNVDNIAREIEDSFDRLSTRMNDLGGPNKFKGSSPGAAAMNRGVNAIGTIFGFMLRFIAKFGVLIAMLVGFALFIALAVSWVAGIWSLFAAAPYIDYFSPYSNATTWLGFTNVFFLLGIPIVTLCLVFIRVLFKVRTPVWLRGSLGIFWGINLISFIFLVATAIKEYRHNGTVTSSIDLSSVRSDTMRVEGIEMMNGNDYEDFWFNHDNDGVRIGENNLEVNGPIEVRVRKSNSGEFRCTQIVKAQGSSSIEAQENAKQIQFDVVTNGNALRIPTAYNISRGNKWRVQRIRLEIEVPEGKSVVFDDKIYHHSAAEMDDYADENDENYISHEPDRVYRMTKEGLICTNCPQMGDRNYRSDRSYEKFIIEGNIQAEIRQGDNFRVEIEGSESDKNKIQKIQSGDKITFTTNGKKLDGPVHVLIETHTFTSLHADNSGEIIIRGFDEGQADISAKGSSAIKAYIDCRSLDIALSGNATLDLTGRGNEMDVNLADGSVLESTNWRAESGEIYASDNARARVFIKNNALVVSTGSSVVKVDGGAEVKNKE